MEQGSVYLPKATEANSDSEAERELDDEERRFLFENTFWKLKQFSKCKKSLNQKREIAVTPRKEGVLIETIFQNNFFETTFKIFFENINTRKIKKCKSLLFKSTLKLKMTLRREFFFRYNFFNFWKLEILKGIFKTILFLEDRFLESIADFSFKITKLEIFVDFMLHHFFNYALFNFDENT